jgi:hypothetical protein
MYAVTPGPVGRDIAVELVATASQRLLSQVCQSLDASGRRQEEEEAKWRS